MGKISDIRAALQTAIATVPGLQAEKYVRDVANVPVAMVGGPDTEYDKTFGRGHDDHTIPIMVFASRASDVDGQDQLDSYLDPFGASSIKAAIEADSTLGGVVDDLRVERSTDYGAHEVNGITYLGAVLMVHVMAPGKA
jgi:hypothetical protein